MYRKRCLEILQALIDGAQVETIINPNMAAEGVPVIQHDELNHFEAAMRELIETKKE